jgi:carbamoyl-phosphate synthase large subunit
MSLPCFTVPPVVQSRLREISTKIAKALDISGPMNTQFLWRGDEIKVIETNVRASRSFPFVSKVYNVDFIETATRIFLGENPPANPKCNQPLSHFAVKAPQFSFQRLLGADPVLSTEMSSTGELACFGKTMHEAFLKSMEATHGFKIPKRAVLVCGEMPQSFVSSVKNFQTAGLQIYATPEAGKLLTAAGVKFTALDHDSQNASNGVLRALAEKTVDLTVNFPSRKEDIQEYHIRRKTVDFGIPLLTNENVATVLAEAMTKYKFEDLQITAYDEYFGGPVSV